VGRGKVEGRNRAALPFPPAHLLTSCDSREGERQSRRPLRSAHAEGKHAQTSPVKVFEAIYRGGIAHRK